MRITHLVCTDNFAGVERHVALLAAAQHDLGHEVTVLGGRQERMRAAIDRPGVSTVPAADRPTAARHLLGRAGRDADLVATHMTDADVVALTSPALLRTPVVSTRHFASRRGATPAHRSVAERLQPRLAAEIAVSEYIAGSIDVDASVVLPGVPDRPDLPPPSHRDRTILVVQRLEPEKSTEVAVAAFAASGLADRGWRLRVAGDGSQRPALQRQAQILGVGPATDFLGHRHDVEELMATSAALLAPCAIEGIGLSVIEAMASGLPVVAAAAGGHLESAGGVEHAALFPAGDHEAAGRLLAELVADPAGLDRYGQALRDRQRGSLTITEQARATDAVYRHALAAASPAPAHRGPRERDLVVISLEPWDQVWRRNQHLVHGLLSSDPGLRVLFVEPGRDPLHAARQGRLPRRGRGLRRGPHLPGVHHDALWLLEPTKLLPRRLDPDQDERWADLVHQASDHVGLTDPTLWVNDPRGALVMRESGWPTLYDITDDWLLADRDPATLHRLRRQEEMLLAAAREVVVCSPSLASTKSADRPVTLVRNAVDVAAVTRPTARPPDLPAGPVAVYVGTLHGDRLDVALCESTAIALEGIGHLVLVGPDALGDLERRRLEAAGARLLGTKDHRSVPAYLQHADVLVVPHVVDDFTDSLDPIKLYEYRAVGRRVVSTPVAGFREAPDERLLVAAAADFVEAVLAAVPATDRFPTGADAEVPTWADRVAEMDLALGRVARTDVPRVEVPLGVRVRFGHAAIQWLADAHGVDLLHIKGAALDPELTRPDRLTSDADVLVRPEHVDRLLDACARAGYRSEGRFETSSPFEHSRTLWHGQWGYLDVHRHYPGIGLEPADAFERMWAERSAQSIAGVACPVPSVPAQAAILVMHAARSPAGGPTSADVDHVWHRASPDQRSLVRAWVTDMAAEVAFTAGTGDLGSLPPSPERDLWQAVAAEGRVREWRARIAVAPDLRSRGVLLLRALLVNTDHLAHELGRRPSRVEIAVAFIGRARRAVVELTRPAGRR
ncbi:glycosyltransferase [Janibacter hoylei]|uniref:glycosyltransferase n=1 Tax=Janibacter hoylei TaxID=364298 RepID=UPI0027BA654C|nr:glycosyltransferase [Janibacter hoylei]